MKRLLVLLLLLTTPLAVSAQPVPDSLPLETPDQKYSRRSEPPSQDEDREDLSWWQEVLVYIPNRVLDVIDIFKIDVGVGPTVGGVIRATEQGQIGYRYVDPFSARLGFFGRQAPFLMESHMESGAGLEFEQTPDRTVCEGEIGLGLDLLVGGYFGICFDEAYDFFAGVILFDPKNDDF